MSTKKRLCLTLAMLGLLSGPALAADMRSAQDALAAGRYEEAFNAFADAAEEAVQQLKREKAAQRLSGQDEARLKQTIAYACGNAANAATVLKRHAEAVEFYEAALTVAPDRVSTRLNFASCLLTLKEAERVIEVLAPLLEATPPHDGALKLKARAEAMLAEPPAPPPAEAYPSDPEALGERLYDEAVQAIAEGQAAEAESFAAALGAYQAAWDKVGLIRARCGGTDWAARVSDDEARLGGIKVASLERFVLPQLRKKAEAERDLLAAALYVGNTASYADAKIHGLQAAAAMEVSQGRLDHFEALAAKLTEAIRLWDTDSRYRSYAYFRLAAVTCRAGQFGKAERLLLDNGAHKDLHAGFWDELKLELARHHIAARQLGKAETLVRALTFASAPAQRGLALGELALAYHRAGDEDTAGELIDLGNAAFERVPTDQIYWGDYAAMASHNYQVGYPDQALALMRRHLNNDFALQLSSSSNFFKQLDTVSYDATTHQRVKAFMAQVLQQAAGQEGVSLAGLAMLLSACGQGFAGLDDHEAALACLNRAEAYIQAGLAQAPDEEGVGDLHKLSLGTAMAGLGEAHGKLGDPKKARALLAQAADTLAPLEVGACETDPVQEALGDVATAYAEAGLWDDALTQIKAIGDDDVRVRTLIALEGIRRKAKLELPATAPALLHAIIARDDAP